MAAPAAAQQDGVDAPIRIQLKWFHQFQFAGFYAAQAQGFFADAGLDVELVEGGPTKDPARAVANGDC